MSQSMIERVTDALCKECMEVFGAKWSGDVAKRFARAALEAMREPTPAMLERAFGYGLPREALARYYREMIDAALKEQP